MFFRLVFFSFSIFFRVSLRFWRRHLRPKFSASLRRPILQEVGETSLENPHNNNAGWFPKA
jgi:hypothetical protein